ncbi:DUF11 domain-containing protein [Myroides profundi]|uniref:Conserved repeat domain-containing protein n=1 Tax=Myroides profundi TaxID=480520 RepID=A0AAJ4W607_MYRPR|nr:DUF11 domain-containing protein [Myroides profundi]AJH15727.1 hypothetical protein MPR_2561 [Myroides profundi]SER33922.1 conserved repeat domain-containing protein [Myroides profundi]
MKQKTTFSLWKRLLLLLVLFVPLVQSYGQTRVDAKLGDYDDTDLGILGGNKPVVENPENVNQFDNKYARLKASPGLAVTLGAYTSYIELRFPTMLKAKQTSYIRLKPDGKLLEGLLGGNLGEALTKLLGGVLTGNQEFDLSVGAGNTPILSGSSMTKFNTIDGIVNVVRDNSNNYYLSITPDKAYDRIKLTNRTGGLLGIGVVKNLDVFHAFTYDDQGANCGRPVVTSFDGGGINLKVLDFKDQNLGHAIDSDPNTFSLVSPGALLGVNVGGSMSQIFYFPTISDEKATVNIRLAVGSSGVLDLNLLGGVEVVGYNGKSQVYQKSLSGGLVSDLNLLNLIKSGKTVDITVAPGKAFDRLEVRLKAPVGVDLLGSSVRIYDVERFDGITCKNPLITIPDATAQPFEVASCSTKLGVFENVDFPYNTVDGNNETYASLVANNGSLLVSSPQSGRIQMKYDSALPANKTSYIRIDAEKGMLNALLGGTLGDLIANVGGLVLGNHIFTVEAYNAAGTSVLKSSSSNHFEGTSNGAVKLVQDNIGRYYLAVTPNQTYQSITVSNSVSSLLPTGEIRTLKVYNMCTDIGTDLCYPAQFTSYSQQGINLSLLDLGKAGVKNPYHAISGNSSNYSEISTGLVAIAGLVKQTVYFNQPSQVGDELKVRLQLDPSSTLSVQLLGNYKVVTYLGSEQKESFTLQQGLINNLNLLDLFKSGGVQTLTFDTKQVFDRVELQVGNLVNVALTPSIRLYDVKRVSSTCPEITTVSPFIKPVCATTVLSASNADDIDNIFSDNFDAYATINSGAGILLGLGNKHSGHIELGYAKEVPANTTSYVRIDFDEKLLNALLGGSLGNVVNGLLNGLILGDHFFEVEVKNAAKAVILDGKSNVSNNAAKGAGTIRIVKDSLGRTYLAITPTVPYQSVRITDKTNSALGLLAQPNSMNVYSMCYESDTNSCVPSFATSYEYSGLALDVKDLSGGGVKNPERAIDNNTTNYSEISSGTLNIAGAVRQYIYFNSDAKAGEETLIKFKTQGGQVNVDLIGALEIKAYKGEKEVDALSSTNGLINGINVLDLLTTGQMVELPFRPKAAYDRISIGMKSLVGVNVGASIHLYDVARTCRVVNPNQSLVSWKSYKVNNDATINTVKGGEVVEYTIHVRNEGTTPIEDFIVKDKMPKGVKYKSSVAGVLTEDEVVFAHKGALAPGATVTFTFAVDVNADLSGIVEIKNIAYVGEAGQEAGKEIFYPSYPPVDNTNPTQPDGTKAPGTVIKVESVCSLTKAVITSTVANGNICEGADLVLDADVIADTYQWYLDGVAITTGDPSNKLGIEKTLKTSTPGNYTVVYTKDACVSSVSDSFIVSTMAAPVITIHGETFFTVVKGEQIVWPNITVDEGTLTYANESNTAIPSLPVSLDTVGQTSFIITATNANGCTSSEVITVTVLDNSDCPPAIQRVYATESTSWGSIITGGVTAKENAIDNDPTTHSRIVTGLGLLGIGTTWQNIYFDHVVPKGTPVTIKLGKEYSGLVLAGGLSVQGLDAKGNTIGTLKPVAGGLLDLLSADNVNEFTFVPSNSKGAQDYKGVRISQGSLVGVAQIAKVYSVFYTKLGSVHCDAVTTDIHKNIADVYHGVGDIGLGVASSVSGVYNPWRAVDNDPDSYATISRVLGVANQAHMTVVFKQQTMPTDELHIITEIPGNPVLSLELIKGYKVQRYLGSKKVGPEIEGSKTNFIDLKLLGINYKNKYKFIVQAFDEPYDRVKITYTTLVSVIGDFVNIYDVNIVPKVDPGYEVGKEYLDMCFGGVLHLSRIDACTEYEVFKSREAIIPLVKTGSTSFKLPNDLEIVEFEEEENGVTKKVTYHVVYVQVYRNGCEAGARVPVYLDMKNCSVKSNLNITHKIK